MANSYRVFGIVLSVAGAVLSPLFYFVVGSAPLTAMGISSIILGFTGIALANARPYISPEACQTLLRTGMENTAALLEELGIRSKAIYLPSSLRNGRPQALVPLIGDGDAGKIKDKLPGRLIVRYGSKPEDMAIAVTTPGSINLDMLNSKPGPAADEIEAAIAYILTGVLDIASGVKVNLADSRVNVEISGSKMGFENIWYYRCLGSPAASVAAAVSSEALNHPVRIIQESQHKDKSKIVLEVLT
jgi:hypothetical protein